MKIALPREKLKFISVAAALLLIFAFALAIRIKLARENVHPGHGDPAFYYTLAQSFSQGHDLNINYVWYFLNGPVNIIHYGADHWNPLTGIVAGLSMRLLGQSMLAALLPFIFANIFIAILAAVISYDYSRSYYVAIFTAILTLFIPSLFRFSLVVDSVVLYVLFALPALYLVAVGRERPKAFLLAASLIALAQLTRQDAILLLFILVIFLVLSPLEIRKKAIYLTGSILIWLIIISPMIIRNYHELGVLFPTGPSKYMYLTHTEELYVYGKNLNLQSYLNWGWENILENKLAAAQYNLKLTIDNMGIFLIIGSILSVGSIIIKKEKNKAWFLAPFFVAVLAFLVLDTLIDTFVTFGSTFLKGLLIIFPVLIGSTIDFLQQTIRSKVVLGVILILITVIYGVQAYNDTNELLQGYNNLNHKMIILQNALKKDAQTNHIKTENIVLMTRNPWEFNATTGMKAVQIPNNDLDTIYTVAKMYKVNYLLMAKERSALVALFDKKIEDARFIPIGYLKNTKLFLYRIQ